MSRNAISAIALALVSIVSIVALASAQSPDGMPFPMPGRDPAAPATPPKDAYKFELGPDVTEAAKTAGTEIKPGFKGLVDDRFNYEFDHRVKRTGASFEGAQPVDAYASTETWSGWFNINLSEDELEGRKDLKAALRYDRLYMRLDDGKSLYTGYIGPESAPGKGAEFKKTVAGEAPQPAGQIPGWPTVNARTIENNRQGQASGINASAWFNIADSGRVYNDTLFADFDVADQRNYPARYVDPVMLLLIVQPEFAADMALKVGASGVVRRRLPIGPVSGGTADYDVTITLHKLYGAANEPTAARLSISAKPVAAAQNHVVAGLNVAYTLPEISSCEVLVDLKKGVAAWVRWAWKLKGETSQPGSDRKHEFACEVDFTASLRKQ